MLEISSGITGDANGHEYYALSESQKSIWYLEKAYPGTSLNIVAGTLRLKGSASFDALEKALNIFVEKSDSMRLRIVEEDGAAYQYVKTHEAFQVDYLDFSQSGGLKALFNWDEGKTRSAFDINDNQLFYCAMFKISDDESGFYVKMHHLISDAWTMGIATRQIIALYSQIKNGLPVDCTPYPSYIEHLKTSEAYVSSARFAKDKEYWNKKFETVPDMTVLKPPKSGERAISARRKTMITPLKLSNKIREFCAAERVSPFTLFMSALSIYINRVTGIEDIVLGTTILNRSGYKEKETTGLFVSVAAPVRISVSDTMDFRTFTESMARENTDIMRHQKYAYNYLIRDLKKTHKLTNRLFDIVLSYQNSKFHKHETGEDYVAKWIFTGCQVESLVISINDREDGGNLIIDYDFLTDVFDIKEIEFIHQHLISLLWHALDNPAKSISKLDMISEKEKNTILHEFNNTFADYPRDKTIHQVFEEQAEKTPERVALIYGPQQMTYAALNERANRLARTLRDKGVGPDKIVGIMTYRSIEMMVGILAILKAGGAYLPIDPAYPLDRRHYMLKNSCTGFLLTQRDLAPGVDFKGCIVNLDDETSYNEDGENLPRVNSPKDLAYVIYTSGSTGQPKGVMVEHTSVVNRINWMQKKYPLNEDSRIIQKTTYCFDVSVWELFWWAFVGASLILINSGDEKDPEEMIRVIEKHQVTTMHFVPSMLSVFLDYVESRGHGHRLSSLVDVFASGEALTNNQVTLFNALLYENNGTRLINLYGPTEATVDVSYFDCSPMPALNSVPIGRPIDNISLYIMDRNHNLLPVGIPGELYIGGVGVARGYLFNPELTAEKFVINPFKPNEILYKTGDRVRWYPKGDIEFLGRMDHQVKIRGFRIELGEIEARLLTFEGVREVVVKAFKHNDGASYLAAYLVADSSMTTETLRGALSDVLPEYMVPSFFIFLDKMPLNSSGKADRKALPEPEAAQISLPEGVGPSNEMEEELVAIWQRVLGLDAVGVLDDYAGVGGDSLSAIRIVMEIYKAYGLELSPKVIFQRKTIRQLSLHLMPLLSDCGVSKGYQVIEHIDNRPYYAVSSAQKRQYIIDRLSPGTAYNLPGVMELSGPLDRTRLETAFNTILSRHESLRTSFEVIDGEPVQIIHDDVALDISYTEDKTTDISALMGAFIRPFDLGSAPLLRVALVKRQDDKYVLMFDMHHIISDGASINVFMGEFTALYDGQALPEPVLQYRDYAAWHNRRLSSSQMEVQEAYWLSSLSGEIPVLNLPLDFSRPADASACGQLMRFSLEADLTRQLKQLAADAGVTLFMLLFSVYNLLLSKYTGQDDIIVGTPVAGRNHEDLHGLIGMFVNTLPIRSKLQGDKPFRAFLAGVRENLLDAYDHQDYPFEVLVEKLGIRRDISRNPLFDTVFVLQNMDLSERHTGGVSVRLARYDSGTAKFDLTVEAVEQGDAIDLSFEYRTDLFRAETIKRLAAHYENALCFIVSGPEIKLSDISILSEAERCQLLTELAGREANYPNEQTITRIFEAQVEKTPDNIALVFDNETMTYRALNDNANGLARTLRSYGVGPDIIVGLIIDRSFDMIVAMLAVLKAGGAYMPIDPSYPQERKTHLLQNSGAKVLLTKKGLAVHFDGVTLELEDNAAYHHDRANMTLVNKPDDLAYIIYTSGSTGLPKGVMTEHRNVVSLLFNHHFEFDVTENDTWSLFHSYCFDFSALEIYGALLRGGRLVIASSEDVKDLEQFLALLKRRQVTVLCQTPQSIYHLLELEAKCADPDLSLRYAIVGGETLKPSQLKMLKARYPSLVINNIYGPTETTIYVTTKRLDTLEALDSDVNNIGPANPLTKLYITDERMNLVPTGVPGELYVGGCGVSRGYINNPQLTGERFVPNPFDGGIMYKTGDLMRGLPGGELEYLGRIDGQVKLRGYRIELGEIEACLLTVPGISQAVVIDRVNAKGDRHLYAYYTSEQAFPVDNLRAALSRRLPDFMLPSFFMRLEQLPLNTNGKLDRKALPMPELQHHKGDELLPESETERALCDIWKSILCVDRIGAHDSFFDLGGNSLNAVSVSSLVYKNKGVDISPRDVFIYPTLRALSAYIDARPKTDYEPIPKVPRCETYPLSSAQKRQHILKLIEGEGTSYNIPGGLILEGNVNRNKIEDAFLTIIQRHESLRTSFELRHGEPVQIIHDNVPFQLEYTEAENADLEALTAAFIRPFDFDRAPLFRAGLVKLPDGKHLLQYDMHHIISDGASLNVLFDEFFRLYSGKTVPDLKIQYKDYAAWHNRLLGSGLVQQQETYWLDRYAGEIPVLNMPCDFARPAVTSRKGRRLTVEVDRELTAQLRQLNNQTETTLFMLLLTAYNAMLYRYTGQEDVVVGTAIEGRRHADLQHLIGMFVNTLAIRSFPAGEKAFDALLSEVRDDLLNAYGNQDYPFEMLVDKVGVRREKNRNPLFDTMLVLENVDMSLLSGAGMSATPYVYDNVTSKLDLVLEVVDNGDTLSCTFEYSTDLFREETIRRMSGHYINILRDVAANPGKKLHELVMLSEDERRQLLCEFNDTDADYPREKTIHQIFEEQAARTPDHVAMVFRDETMTYQVLNERANRLARTLRARGVGPETVVGLVIDRSLDMVVAMLAVLKAGGAYMPMDPDYPQSRIEYMLENSGAALLVTRRGLLVPVGVSVLDIDALSSYDEDGSNLEPVSTSTNLAYIIYTSGSTGRPKGVMTEHRNVVGLFFNSKFDFVFDKNDVWTMYHSYCFDLSAWELFGALLHGCTLIIIPVDVAKNQYAYLDILRKHGVTVLTQTPRSVYSLVELEQKTERAELKIRYVIMGGEALNPSQLRAFHHRYPLAEFVNQYGPTETTMYVTQKKLDVEDFEKKLSNIGAANPLTQTYVLDNHRNLVPIGVSGELCIGGNGVSRGYINNQQLTKERFICNPFRDKKVVYKTGDLVKMMPNGNIEYLGRIDGQIKIRGYRIELGEIEHALLQHPVVEEAVVLANDFGDNDKRVCAYLKTRFTISTKELNTYLLTVLPDYMLPAHIIFVEAFPLNKSGKIDKASLPKPGSFCDVDLEIVYPRNKIEMQIAQVWSSVLNVHKISIDDDFFAIGGDSLSAVKVVSMLEIDIKIMDLYSYPTIRQLSEKISTVKKNAGLLINMSKRFDASNCNVICFPYGGGSILSFRDICHSVDKANAKLNIYGVNLPGHDYGTDDGLEPIEKVAFELADEILCNIKGDIILYSHCAGSALLLAVANILESHSVKIKAVFIGAMFPPRIKHNQWLRHVLRKSMNKYSDNFVAKYLKQAGLPDDMLKDNDYVRYMGKVLWHDNDCQDTYFSSYNTRTTSKLRCIMYSVVGDKDPATRLFHKRYRRWNSYFETVRLIVLCDAGHFFINSHSDQLVKYITGI